MLDGRHNQIRARAAGKRALEGQVLIIALRAFYSSEVLQITGLG